MSEPATDAKLTVDKNPFALTGRRENNNGGGMVAVASSRQAQEVQAAMAIAKRFPRDKEEAYSRIMQSCQRKGLAEAALYSYPKGGQQITGPSIRLAETLAQNWGNLDFGIIELEQREGESTVMAYCWDLETNTRQTKIFQVAHERHTRAGIVALTDPRDLYELVANQGARRLRSCILGVIPGDVIDSAVEQCDKTMKGANKEPLIDRIRVMTTKFSEDFSVSVAMLEKKLLHKLDATNEQEMVMLRKIYTSLKDGMTKREDWFELVDTVQSPEGLSKSPPQGDAQREPKETVAAPTASAEPGEQPVSSPAASSVPNETLGANKPAKPKAEKKPPEPGSRQAMVEELRTKFTENGIAEREFLQAAVKLEILSAAVTSASALGSDLLSMLLERYQEIVAEVS